MDHYVVFSIVFFCLIIFFLYIYIILEKIGQLYKNKKIRKYHKEIVPYISSTIKEIEMGQNTDYHKLENIKKYCTNKYKREIIEMELSHYLENNKDKSARNIIKLCEYIGVVKYEIKKFRKGDNFSKALCAKMLGQFRSNAAVEVLLQQINTSHSDVKYNILLALSKIGDEKSFVKAFENINILDGLTERSLIEIADSFEGNKSEIYKSMIDSENILAACVFIKSAGNFKQKSLSDAIAKYLSSKNKEKKIAAVKAIGNMADEKYLDDIIKLMEESEWEVRAVAAKALDNFNSKKILQPLAKALSDSNWHVRYNAADSTLNQEQGIDVVYYILQGQDKFAKDIIISAIENSSNDKLNLYETSDDNNKKRLAFKIKQYMCMLKKDEKYEYKFN